MELQNVDLTNATEEELLSALENNAKVNNSNKEQIRKMENVSVPTSVEVKEKPSVVLPCEKKETKKENTLAKELDGYVQMVKSIGWDNLGANIDSILPDKNDPNYRNIIKRLKLEASKEIRDIDIFLLKNQDSLLKEDLDDCNDIVEGYIGINSMLDEKLGEETNTLEDTDSDENKLVFMPTKSGNMAVENDLGSIVQERYGTILKLFKSIKDGTFKNDYGFDHMLTLKGLRTVCDQHAYVVYQQLSDDTYLIVSILVKKDTRDKKFFSSLETRYTKCRQMLDKIKENINNEEFMKLQKEYELDLFRRLGDTKKDSKGAYINA